MELHAATLHGHQLLVPASRKDARLDGVMHFIPHLFA